MRTRLALLCIVGASFIWGQSFAIQRVTVIDATGKPAQPNMTVVIVGDRIAAVGPTKTTKIQKNAQIINGEGKFLIPGLWDMHVHGAADDRSAWTYPLFLANGVTGVREMFGPHDGQAWRARQMGVVRAAPDVYLGSPVVDGPNPQWPGSIIATNEVEGRNAVDEQLQRGADFIKVYSRLPREVYFAIAEQAQKRGIPFEGHVPESVTAAEASEAGQKSIEHLSKVAQGCSREENAIAPELSRMTSLLVAPTTPMSQKMIAGPRQLALQKRLRETFDQATAESLFSRFVKNGTWQCPTLTVLRAQMDNLQRLNDSRLKYLDKATRSFWEAGFYKGVPPQARGPIVESVQADYQLSLRIVGMMNQAGVKLLAGTDAGNPECFPGFGLHDELALLVDAGLSPLEALQTATRNAAEFMGQSDRRGTIQAGKIADLVLLERNPLADIHNTRSVEAVVLRGRFIERSALDEMLAQAETAAGRTNKAGE